MSNKMKILVFTEGTIIMHPSAAGLTREQRVAQSKKGLRSVCDYAHYIPNGNAVKKLQTWKKQGGDIFYLTSRTSKMQVNDVKNVLKKFGFPDSQNLLFCRRGEQYNEIAEKLMPDILIEDDCESIGGEAEMTYPHIGPEVKKKIKSIVVKEFSGIDHLPDKISNLINCKVSSAA